MQIDSETKTLLIRAALALADHESFLAGFEDDEMQEGLDVMLAENREVYSQINEQLGAELEWKARVAGWDHGGDNGGFWFHRPTWGSWKSAASWSGTDQEPQGDDDHPALYDTLEELCAAEDL